MQEIIKSFSCDVETIINVSKPKYNRDNSLKKRINNLKGQTPKEIYKKSKYKLWVKLNKTKIQYNEKIRTEIFKSFTLDYIKETNYKICDDNIPPGLENEYDYFVTGSDQVWNPSYIYDSSIYFLTFAPKNRRIAMLLVLEYLKYLMSIKKTIKNGFPE